MIISAPIPNSLRLLLLLACLLSGCAVAPPSVPADARERTATNVVLIIVDDLGWKDTGAYGSTFYETPHIDRLAQEGTRFTHFYSASPVCSPTRASLMTGKHPARLDLTNWIGGEQNGLLRQASYVRQLAHSEVTVGEALKARGYTTGYIGKWHLGRQAHLPQTQGFDWTFAVNEAGQPGSYFPPYENPRWSITNVPDLEGAPDGSYLTDRLTDAAVDFIEERQEESFFLVLSHYAVHTPLQAPTDLVERYRLKAAQLSPPGEEHYEAEHKSETRLRQDHPVYAAMVDSVDRSVGRILDRLDMLQLSKNTIVVFVSDNGGLSTLRRRSSSQATANHPLRSGKGWLYEGGIRIPLIIRHPDSVTPGAINDLPAMTTDIFPTILGLIRTPLQPRTHLDGIDLLSKPAPRPLFWHFPHYHGSGMLPGGAVRDGNLKLIEWFEDNTIELYDLVADPGERLNLSQSLPQEANRLRQMLHTWRSSIDANMPTRARSE